MAITSADIHNQSFSIDRKGYDVDEVDVFLEHVANEIDDLNASIDQLETDINNGEYSYQAPPPEPAKPDVSAKELAKKESKIADLEQQLEEKKANDYAIAQALIIAQRSADDILDEARDEANRIVQEAEDEAARIIEKANNERKTVNKEIEKLEDQREDARMEYQAILKDFISDASKKLSDLGATIPKPQKSAHSKAAAPKAERSMPRNQAPIRASSSGMPYTTPQPVTPSGVVPVTPRPSRVEKDLSGFGDTADSFEFNEID